MEMLGKLYNRIKKYQAPSERFLFPLILLLWPLTGIAQGVDLADSTYALGNYRFLAGSGSTWDVATFLANRLGAFLLKLPGGGTLRGMNLWTSLLVSALALMVYFVMQRFMPGWMLFVGEMLAVSLCWCPGVILYNYLTYFLLTAACLMLFLGISSVPEKNRYFVFAGILLGLNLFVRFSNLTQTALILAVWFHTFITLQKSTKLIPRTLSCLGGYLIGAGIGMAAVTAAYGPTAFADMVRGLFSMTAGAGDYTMGAMLSSTLSAYLHSLRWFVFMAAGLTAGYIAFSLPALRRFSGLLRAGYIAGILVLIRFFYGQGMFTVNYRDYWCMFEWGMQFVLLSVIVLLLSVTGALRATPEERFIAMMGLILILILPLGSNNYTFPLLNNLFLIAPISLWMLRKSLLQVAGMRRGRAGKEGARIVSGRLFAVSAMAFAILFMALLQGGLFHVSYAFRDGTDGTRRSAVIGEETTPVLAGMHTTPQNAERIRDLSEALENSVPADAAADGLITMGSIPGVHFCFDLPPALTTLWPDLNSYPVAEMEKELGEIAADGRKPLLLFTSDAEDLAGAAGEKYELLRAFRQEADYEILFENDDFVIMGGR